ncbi:MAG TPA: LysR family transcriptional regulator [Terriglobales bacterium]|nr:LysR family transcriptional regulator [Terriglobales bacterium]
MEFRQLKYFVAAAEELNFTKAAKRLGIAQPPVSRQIAQLERELEVQLFQRTKRQVQLTDAGQRFLSESRALLRQAEAAVEIARQAKMGAVATIRVAMGYGLGDIVSHVINHQMRLVPGVDFDIVDSVSGPQSDALAAGRIDVGFLRPPVTSLEVVSQKLFSERLTAVLRKSSALARRARLLLKDLRNETVLLINRPLSPGVHDKTLELYRRAGVSPQITPVDITCYEEAGAMMVATGKGIYLAVGKNPIHPSFADQLVAIPLAEASAFIEVHIAWRKDESSPAILSFLDTARGLFKHVSGILDLRPDPSSLFLTPSDRQDSRRSKSTL